MMWLQRNVQRERRSLQVLVSAAASVHQQDQVFFSFKQNFEKKCKPPPPPPLENVTSSLTTPPPKASQQQHEDPVPVHRTHHNLMVRFGDFVVQMQMHVDSLRSQLIAFSNDAFASLQMSLGGR